MSEYFANMFESKTKTRNTCRGLAYKGTVLNNHLPTNIPKAPTMELFRTKYMAEHFTKFQKSF